MVAGAAIQVLTTNGLEVIGIGGNCGHAELTEDQIANYADYFLEDLRVVNVDAVCDSRELEAIKGFLAASVLCYKETGVQDTIANLLVIRVYDPRDHETAVILIEGIGTLQEEE